MKDRSNNNRISETRKLTIMKSTLSTILSFGCLFVSMTAMGFNSPVASSLEHEQSSSDTYAEMAPAPGCTDPCACNYDPAATEDDGSCILPELLAVPGDLTIECTLVPLPVPPVGISGGCTDTVVFSETSTPGSCANNFTLTRTWTVTLGCGLVISDSQEITVVDSQAPILLFCPQGDFSVVLDDECAYELPDFHSASVFFDNCSTVITSQTPAEGSFISETTVVQIAITDECGNETTCDFTITVSIVQSDSDLDGIGDWDETCDLGTDPNDPDTDGDGISDGAEVNITGTSPLLEDTDGNGLSDLYESCPIGGLEGCTYLSASNYNPAANSDDGSCDFSCPEDLTGDGVVATGDLLQFLTLFGSLCP